MINNPIKQTPWLENIDGNNKTLSNVSTFSIGSFSTASGINSMAIGSCQVNPSDQPTIIASGLGAVAIGRARVNGGTGGSGFILASGEGSFAGGLVQGSGGTPKTILASGLGSFAWCTGGGLTASNTGSIAFGQNFTNNTSNSFMVGWSTTPTLTIVAAGVGILTTPTAYLTLAAGTASAGTAPLRFTSGVSLTTAVAGAVEFTTDDYYATITTGAARKGIILNDGTNLTLGRIPVATTNGRLKDFAGLTWDGTTFTATGINNIALPHIMQSDSTNQAIANTANAQVLTFDTDVHHFNITRTSSSRFTVTQTGSYRISFNGHAAGTTSKVIELWMRVNGNDVANSNVQYQFKATSTLALISGSYLYHFTAGDYFELWTWGDDTSSTWTATAAGVTPTRPACPSITMTANFVGYD